MDVARRDSTEAGRLREAGNPCLFIVGCLRSGTTVFRHIVDAHPDLAVVNETQWLPGIFEQCKYRGQRDLRRETKTRDVLLDSGIVTEVLEHERFERLGLSTSQVRRLAAGPERLRYEDFVARVFDAAGILVGKELVGEKSPGYVRHLPTLRFLWPHASFVHLIRDGRDVCASLMGWKPEKQQRTIGRFSTWSTHPFITAGLWWEWHVRLGLEARAWMAPQVHEVRYEALVAAPEDECRALCTFLDLAYEPQMLQFHERGGQAKPDARRGPSAPLTAGLRDWRTDLDSSQRVQFEATAGDLLDELGYGRSVTIDAQTRRIADEVRDTFAREAAVRRRKVLAWTEVHASSEETRDDSL
jgi:hypothetical protein